MTRGAELVFGAALAWLAAALVPAAAQEAVPPRAPRILDAPAARDTAAEGVPAAQPPPGARPPNAARLAPLPEERANEDIEEIIITGQGWRLPDLGSEWRARQQEAARASRFSATVLPLYDPTRPPLRSEALLRLNPEQRRHGVIELFRLRFGRRSRD
jgi:hypothetical protein